MKSDENRYNLKFIRNILLVLLCIVAFYLLNQLSHLIIPLVLASLFVMLLLPPVQWLIDHKVPRWIIVPIIAITTIFLLAMVGNIVINTIQELIKQQEFLFSQFEKRLTSLVSILQEKVSFELNNQIAMDYILDSLNKDNVTGWAKNFALGIGSFSSSFMFFAIYFILLLTGVSNYKQYLHFVGGGKRDLSDTVEMLQKTISTYMGIKTIISLTTGLLAGLICLFFGIKFPLFWGFLTFILNYIPSIGSILATIPPVVLAFIQFDSFPRVIAVLALLTTVQMTIGNVIDPMIMGDRLRLNTITVIFGLLFWGFIWGIPGMLISVPLMVIIKVILEKSETWSMIARAMASSQDKNIYRLRRKKARIIKRERAKRDRKNEE